MIYLLDTDTLIFMIRGMKRTSVADPLRRRAQKLVDCCRSHQLSGETVAASAITIAELEYGARRADRPQDELRSVEKVLSPFHRLAFEPSNAPSKYADIRAQLEADGQPIGAMELLIAAHALSLGATLVTNNTAHFGRISGLAIENWSLLE